MLEMDYYLARCPACHWNNEFLDEVCPNCGQKLHIDPAHLDLSDLIYETDE